jgi:hypothetical protein
MITLLLLSRSLVVLLTGSLCSVRFRTPTQPSWPGMVPVEPEGLSRFGQAQMNRAAAVRLAHVPAISAFTA